MRLFLFFVLNWAHAVSACELDPEARQRTFGDYAALLAYIKSDMLPASRNAEKMGLVYADAGGLLSIAAHGCPMDGGFSFRLKRTVNLVALWHTRDGLGYLRELALSKDEGFIQVLEAPLYLITPSGSVRVLDLASDSASPQLELERDSIMTASGYSGSALMVATNR